MNKERVDGLLRDYGLDPDDFSQETKGDAGAAYRAIIRKSWGS